MHPIQKSKTLSILITSIVLNLVGWVGLILLLNFSLPTLGPRWIFFLLLTIAISGLALPILFFLHLRFPTDPPAEMNVYIREALFVSIFVDMLAWLQLGRVLSPLRAFLVAVGMVAIEFFIRLRERSKFKPKEPVDE
jgi:hypothetical protein